VGGSGDGEDGYLQSTEIVDRDWQGTELAVPGASETALGFPSIGDGVYGMRRPFIVAGVRSQVMTFWQVGKRPHLSFLGRLRIPCTLARARRRRCVMLSARCSERTPTRYYWAGFYFVGDPTVSADIKYPQYCRF
jgi:CHAT domain-containing protein